MNKNDRPLPRLRVTGGRLTDETGAAVQLRGIGTHGIGWYPQYINPDCFTWLKNDMNCDIVRLALYVTENGGYCTGGDRKALDRLVRDGIRFAADAGLYVIVDWHVLREGDPGLYTQEAISFFESLTSEFGNDPHILYEICNEPNGVEWKRIREYALSVIPAIRRNAPDAVILIGTPEWSQRIDAPAEDPVTEYDNLMYTLHFYAATHSDALYEERLRFAAENGTPVFVSEFGMSDANGVCMVDLRQAEIWLKRLDALGISYIAWGLDNKDDLASLLEPACSKVSGFRKEDLNRAGKWLARAYRSPIGRDVTEADLKGEDPYIRYRRGDMECGVKTVDCWETGGKVYTHFKTCIVNRGKTAAGTWQFDLPFSVPFDVDDHWCTELTAGDRQLTIRPVEYNRCLAPGQSVDHVGFILRADERVRAVSVRKADKTDLPGLKRLLYAVNQLHADGRPDIFKSGGIKYTDGELTDLLQDPDRPVWVYTEDRQILGYVFCILEETKETSSLRPMRTLYIDDLCVDAEARGRGIGRILYRKALDLAREAGCARVTLHAWNFNTAAYGFYEKLGMTPLVTTMEQKLEE